MSDTKQTAPEPSEPMPVPRRMLDVDQVLELIPVSRMTLFRMERDRKFPASLYVSANRRFWYADEVAAWQAALPSNRRIGRRRTG